MGIGIATAVFTTLVGAMDATWSIWGISIVSFLVGVTSSGWNGLFFSELVRFAPEGQTGDAAAALQFDGSEYIRQDRHVIGRAVFSNRVLEQKRGSAFSKDTGLYFGHFQRG